MRRHPAPFAFWSRDFALRSTPCTTSLHARFRLCHANSFFIERYHYFTLLTLPIYYRRLLRVYFCRLSHLTFIGIAYILAHRCRGICRRAILILSLTSLPHRVMREGLASFHYFELSCLLDVIQSLSQYPTFRPHTHISLSQGKMPGALDCRYRSFWFRLILMFRSLS